MKLLLTGYRATGKTSVGKLLAERLGVEFVDTDQLIQKRAGKSVSDIVTESGWDSFRPMERDVLTEVTSGDAQIVISCGGGAVLHEEIFDNLPDDACSVWLRASVDTIVNRIEGDSSSDSLRPSLSGEATLHEEVRSVLSQRKHLYSKFSICSIDTDSMGVEEIVGRLEDIWRQVSS